MSGRSRNTLRQIRSLLRCQTTLVLATVDAGGNPRGTPLWFIAGGDLRVYWFSSRASRHSRNCARHPRVSLAFFRSTRHWEQIQGLQMDGAVSVVSGRRLRAQIAAAYGARFGLGDEFRAAIRNSALYCFTPDRVRYLDNAEGFGAKIELRNGDLPQPGAVSS